MLWCCPVNNYTERMINLIFADSCILVVPCLWLVVQNRAFLNVGASISCTIAHKLCSKNHDCTGMFYYIYILFLLPFHSLYMPRFTTFFSMQGSCPSCKRRFIGYRSQMVVCNYCKAVVWQPRQDFSKGESDPSIIDVEIE